MNPRVVLMSIWRNDEDRFIDRRISHLLAKTYDNLRYVWVVGDSDDETEEILYRAAREHLDKDITVIKHNTGVVGNDPRTRVKRISQTYNAGFDQVREDDVYWCLHESDLISPPDIIEKFLATGLCPVAGWITLGENGMFYDTWAYRTTERHFTNQETRPALPFRVESFGSVGFWHAEDLRNGLRVESMDFVEICEKLRERGRELWVDPRITIVQPTDLWIAYFDA